jgi:glycosyltransferase involved in cell wall biosynthesis
MKIYHVVFSTSGGAGKSAVRLCEQQQNAGIDAEIVSLTDGNIRSVIPRYPRMFLLALFDFFIVRSNKQNPLFSLYRNRSIKKLTEKLIKETCIIHLHWHIGMIDTSKLIEQNSKIRQVVVTLHDMWFLTGGCHQSLKCQKFESNCSNCPQVRKAFQKSVSLQQSRKVEVAKHLPNFVAIAPSQWIKSKAQQSAVLKHNSIVVIPNVLDVSIFKPGNRKLPRTSLSIEDSGFVIGVCAKDLSDPIKQCHEILEMCERFQISNPLIHVVMLAIGGRSEFLTSDILRIVKLGEIKSEQSLVSGYQSMDVLIVASQIETAPTIINEASSCGIPVITVATGGSAEGVIHNSTGKIVSSIHDLPTALIELYSDRKHIDYSANSRTFAEKTFSHHELMNKYRDVYKLPD